MKRFASRLLASVATATLVLSATACTSLGGLIGGAPAQNAPAVDTPIEVTAAPDPVALEPAEPPAPVGGCAGQTIGISMPSQLSGRWLAGGTAAKDQLEAVGCVVNLQFANDDVATQRQQIDSMIADEVGVLVVGPVDGAGLSHQLQTAADHGIPVVSYDRLLQNTENVNFLVAFDNVAIGRQQAESLLQGLGLIDANGNRVADAEPKRIELFAGDPNDSNSNLLWQGAMDTLQPLITDGTLIVGSGQTTFAQAATAGWAPEAAHDRMAELLTANYGGGTHLDGVLSPDDGISRSVIAALEAAGYGPGIANGMPIVTGQNADLESVRLINDDVQYATIFTDPRQLASAAAQAARAFAVGITPNPNDSTTHDNGAMIVPAFVLGSDIVTKDTVQPMLIDSGFLSAEQLGG